MGNKDVNEMVPGALLMTEPELNFERERERARTA